MVREYIAQVPGAKLISLPAVGHGFSVKRIWQGYYLSAYHKLLNQPDYAERVNAENVPDMDKIEGQNTGNLPLTILPAAIASNQPLVLFISGDGGWTSFDQEICANHAAHRMPVLGLDAQKYFWNGREPQETANALQQALLFYMQRWDSKTLFWSDIPLGRVLLLLLPTDLHLRYLKNSGK